MRVFVALDIDEAVRDRMGQFVDGVRGFAPQLRWVRSESLHVTLKFLGEQAPVAVKNVEQTLHRIEGPSVSLTFRGYGFFPNAKAPRVFWAGIEAGPELASLAKSIDEKLVTLGIPREEHAYVPHLTLARNGRGSGSPYPQKDDRRNSAFEALQQKLAAMPTPEFGSTTAQQFFLYESRLARAGSQYTKLKRFALR